MQHFRHVVSAAYDPSLADDHRPDSGKVTAKGKGVRRETESEGGRRQTSGLTDRNPIKGLRVKIAKEIKVR